MLKTLYEIKPVRDYLNRVGAEMRSLRVAIVKSKYKNNYWRDIHRIKFDDSGNIKCSSAEVQPTEQEAGEIKLAFDNHELPTHIHPDFIPPLPKKISEVCERDRFIFYNSKNQLIMMQTRRKNKQGDKVYIPWTFWSDKQWRACEPDGKLPLWGINQLTKHEVAFIHEGAKSARNALEFSKSSHHPWANHLRNAAHVGWIGGAMNVARTDWGTLKGVQVAYIVADNDDAGHEAVRAISKNLKCITYLISFGRTFPTGFDLGDDFPEELFDDKGFYHGPSFHDCMGVATWMTDVIKQEKGRPIIKLRRHAKSIWSYIPDADVFVNEKMPELIYTRQVLDADLAKFSDTNKTSELIIKNQAHGNKRRLTYRPDKATGYIIDENRNSGAINTHRPGNIKPVKGDCSPWLEFMEYLVPDKNERHEVMRWCATLIAKPEIRINYALLMVSERQGIGKTTLGTFILAPLIGLHNVSFPSEIDICSQFNEWIANKRLAVVNEIYTGQSWKSYNLLKTSITDHQITVNKKFRAQYKIDNWCHIFACSNSLRPLKIDPNDRRWFYPELTNKSWPKQKFIEFREWLDGQGLSIIYQWAIDFADDDYIHSADIAPRTDSKELLIEDSLSDEKREARRIASIMSDAQEPIAVTMSEVRAHIKRLLHGRCYDSNLELRKSMKSAGVFQLEKRYKILGSPEYILGNDAFIQEYQASPVPERSSCIKRRKRAVSSIAYEDF